ncbi:MAG TPA: hypothetical protein VKY39_07575, partial [Aggregatilineales bacterium]|nr:hypothetical protein [Aggregatilineales bacterium]
MPGDPREQLKAKYERGGWPSQARPDAGPPVGWSIPLIMSVPRPRSHTPSPDGARIAYLLDESENSNLYVMSARGGLPAALTWDRDPVAYWSDDPPQWSPDGQWLAFTDKDHVWVVPAAGGLPCRVSDFTGDAGSPRWMPDSAGLLVTITRRDRTRV